jgi:hypothetical protein
MNVNVIIFGIGTIVMNHCHSRKFRRVQFPPMVLIQNKEVKMKSNIYWIIIKILEHGEYFTELNEIEQNEILRNGFCYSKEHDKIYKVFKLEE